MWSINAGSENITYDVNKINADTNTRRTKQYEWYDDVWFQRLKFQYLFPIALYFLPKSRYLCFNYLYFT